MYIEDGTDCYVLFILYVYIVAGDRVRVHDTGENCVLCELCVYCLELEGTSNSMVDAA